MESVSVHLPLEPQIDTIGSNVIDNGEIGNYSITMLSTVNYRRKRLLTMIPGELTSAQLSGQWRRNCLIICSGMNGPTLDGLVLETSASKLTADINKLWVTFRIQTFVFHATFYNFWYLKTSFVSCFVSW